MLDAVPMVNLHFSLLPRWRGAAPVERAILAGDTETGVCLMQLEEGLDTGPVFACERIAVDDRVTADELRTQLGEIGSRLLVDELTRGLGTPTPQDGEPTYAAKIDSADLEIDWTRPAVEIARLVRVGRAWTTFRGNRLLVVRGAPGAGRCPASPASSVARSSRRVTAATCSRPCSRRGGASSTLARGATARDPRQASGSVRDRPACGRARGARAHRA